MSDKKKKLTRDDCEVREITVKVRLTIDPNRSTNIVEFWPAACDVTDDDGEQIGSICSGFGANTVVRTKASGESWTLYADDFWYAVQEQIHGIVEEEEGG